MKTNDEIIKDVLARLEKQSFIKPNKIPDLDLYMDQVTTFMNEHLQNSKRYQEDKVLTKTMINNYAKNNLLPPPVKKKYSKNHILLLIFIYYFKNILTFHDIEQLLQPITEKHFSETAELSLSQLYETIFLMEESQIDHLKEDLHRKFNEAKKNFPDDQDNSDESYQQLFALICELSFDIYMKKQVVEFMIDQLREEQHHKKK